ncbi:MAG: DUF1285 domain-containing protein [Deltaproteobacteria bacterium]|nr:DUF1285 domain-containing protein [Deltaproteobacteria bacterium]
MNHSCDEPKEDLFDVSPYLKLSIDKDGRWFQNGAEIVHPEIYSHFCRALEKTSDGEYRVRIEKEICRVHVEDAPFVVVGISLDPGGELIIHLNDGSEEPLDPNKIWIGRDNVPYSKVKKGAFHARFSRPAYYRLAERIVEDKSGRSYSLELKGRRYPIRIVDQAT